MKETMVSETNKRVSESVIVDVLQKHIVESGIPNVWREFQVAERSADLAWVNGCTGELCAAEAKVADVTRAFRQAERYLLFADRVYVALLRNSTNGVARQLSQASGIGLILVSVVASDVAGARVEIVVEACASVRKLAALSRMAHVQWCSEYA